VEILAGRMNNGPRPLLPLPRKPTGDDRGHRVHRQWAGTRTLRLRPVRANPARSNGGALPDGSPADQFMRRTVFVPAASSITTQGPRRCSSTHDRSTRASIDLIMSLRLSRGAWWKPAYAALQAGQLCATNPLSDQILSNDEALEEVKRQRFDVAFRTSPEGKGAWDEAKGTANRNRRRPSNRLLHRTARRLDGYSLRSGRDLQRHGGIAHERPIPSASRCRCSVGPLRSTA